jgi:hypothetical protein
MKPEAQNPEKVNEFQILFDKMKEFESQQNVQQEAPFDVCFPSNTDNIRELGDICNEIAEETRSDYFCFT